LEISTFLADTAVHISSVGAVLEVILAACCQAASSAADHSSSVLVEAPDLIGGQAKVTEHSAERLAAIYRVEELLPYFGG
jgi:hypothetical protein